MYFINPEALADVGLNTENIMSWAETWDHSPHVPKFKHTSDETKSNVRVKIGMLIDSEHRHHVKFICMQNQMVHPGLRLEQIVNHLIWLSPLQFLG